MKATFSSTKKIDFKPIDVNESILLKNFDDISENKIAINVVKNKSEEDEYSLIVKDPAKIVLNDNLNDKTINMLFPKKVTETLTSHDIITTKGGVKFICEVEDSNISVKMVSPDNEVILYNILADGSIKVNVQSIKIYLTLDMTVSAIDENSIFYSCFTI